MMYMCVVVKIIKFPNVKLNNMTTIIIALSMNRYLLTILTVGCHVVLLHVKLFAGTHSQYVQDLQ